MMKKTTSIFLFLLLLLSVCGFAAFAEGETTKEVTYIDASGTPQTVEAIVAVPGSHYSTSDEANWYVIEGTYSGDGALFFEDAVTNLILADDADWTITNSDEISIGNVNSEGTLNVYAQANNSAKLHLAGGMISYYGAVNIYGGSIFSSYKIGGSPSKGDLTASNSTLTGSLYGKDITLRNCTVTGNTGNCTGAFTLDGGSYTSVCGSYDVPVRAASIVITNATVEGSGGQFGLHATGGSVTISDSTVKVTAGNMGISGSGVSISGGNVTATGTGNFGIYSSGGPIKITGGTVAAKGGTFGLYGRGVVLTGGVVTAAGNAAGVNPGGTLSLGADDPDCSYTLGSVFSGGTVTVKDGQALTDGENEYTGTLSTDQVAALAGKTLTAFDPFAADKAAFAAYKEEYKAQLDELLQDGDSEAVVAIVNAAKAVVDATAYDESKTLLENKVALTANYVSVVLAVAYERVVGPFNAYRDQLVADANALLQEGDSEAVAQIIADAVAALNDAQYDPEKSLDENKAALDTLVSGLADAVAAQRAADAEAAAVEAAKAVLASEIEDARAYYETIKDEYPEIADDLDTRLQRAEAVLGSSDATLEDVDAMTELVRAALEAAQEAVAAAQSDTPDEPDTPDDSGDCPYCGKHHAKKWVLIIHLLLWFFARVFNILKK